MTTENVAVDNSDIKAVEVDGEIMLDKTVNPIGKTFKFQNQDDTFTHWMFISKGPSVENPGNEDYTVYHVEGNVTDTVDCKAFHEFISEFVLEVNHTPIEQFLEKKAEIKAK